MRAPLRLGEDLGVTGSVATFDWRSMGSQELGGETVHTVNSKLFGVGG
jgi:hypothetical protein